MTVLPPFMVAGVAFLFGLAVGSFMNVCIYRMPNDMSITGRSRCPHCDELIRWYDNIPLISYLLLGGRCRSCGDPIHARYPLVEFVSGLIFAGTAWWWLAGTKPDWINFFVVTTFVLLTFVISIIDLETSIIPNELNYFLLLAGLVLAGVPHYPFVAGSSLTFDGDQFGLALLGFLIGGGLFFFLAVISPYFYGRAALGMGDVKLIGAFGLWLGPRLVLFTIIAGALVGALVGTVLMSIQGKSLRTEIPFGPYLCLAGVVGMFWGHEIINWYLALTRVQL